MRQNPNPLCSSLTLALLGALAASAAVIQPGSSSLGGLAVEVGGVIEAPAHPPAVAQAVTDARRIGAAAPPTQQDLRSSFFRDQRIADADSAYPALRVFQESRRISERIAEAEALRSPRAIGGIQGWQNIGPGNIGGRTRAIVIDPVDPGIMYAVGVSGGIWKSVTGGADWFPTGDGLVNLNFSTLVMDPTDTSTLYAGSGEGVFGGNTHLGVGIFKTTDAGANWTLLPGSITGAAAGRLSFVNKLVISPNDSDRIYAGARTGVWRSDDAGATWEVVLRNQNYLPSGASAGAGATALGCMDLAIRGDTDPDTIFASFGSFQSDGLYRSEDGGTSWTWFQTPSNQGRTMIAVAPSDNDVVYLCMADNGSGGGTGQLVSVFRSIDGGDTWESRIDFGDPFGPWLLSNLATATGCIDYPVYSQGWYDNALAVDPTDPDSVWVAGIDLFKSVDGARTFELAAYWFTSETAPTYVHADKHAIVFHPDFGPANQEVFIGSDGGIGHTFDASAATGTNDCPINTPFNFPEIVWEELNNSYTTTQFYHGDSAQTADVFIGGAQDNGTNRVGSTGTPNGWATILGGDGGYVAIDPTDEQTIYAEIQFFPEIYKSTNGGASFTKSVNGITDTDGVFIVPFAMDQNDPEILWTGGHNPWRTTNGAALWESAGTIPASANQISAIGIAPSDSSTVYLGYNNGRVYRSTNALDAAPAWTSVSGPFGGSLPTNGWVSSIAVDPGDPDRAYCTMSTFGIGHVYQTTDGGANWSRRDGFGGPGAIPDIPVHWLAIRACDTYQLYVGTELGVYVSEDAGATWAPSGAGMPNVIVESLDFQNENTLVAFTYGRGVYTTSLEACCPGDLNGDSLIDTADLGILISAFGTTSADADINGDGIVDTADLGALIGAFGASCD